MIKVNNQKADSSASKNNDISLETLPPYQPRRFVPAGLELTNRDSVAALYRQLADRPIDNTDQLEQWLADRSELEAAVAQCQSILYIRMTCQTDDPQRAAAYRTFMDTVVPAVKPLSDKLDRKWLLLTEQLQYQPPRYAVYSRTVRSDVQLYRDANVPLQTQDALLSQQYQTLTGAMTVPFEGRIWPIVQMRKFLLETDRPLRQRAWMAASRRYLQDKDQLDDIFDKMISVRSRIAENAGFSNYRDYKFREYHRFDYTPQDCRQFHAAVRQHLVPLLKEMLGYRAKQMGLDKLRPWDLNTDPLGRAPLRPFETTQQFAAGVYQMFAQLDRQFGEGFRMMMDSGLLDLESRPGKAPGGYQSTLYEARKPFIFMNAIGTNDDLRVLMHEGGHAFHTLACADEPLWAYRHAPMEFCEVASMSMELLAGAHLSVCYDHAQRRRWWREQLETIVRTLVSVAVNDAFQHWLYEHPAHTPHQRNAQWLALNQQYEDGIVDWSGLEDCRASMWQRILHFYQVPFYYIEYGIAQLGALGIWLASLKNRQQAIAQYKTALALGGSRPLTELFAAAGIPFDFSADTIKPLAQAVRSQWMEYCIT